VAVQAELTKVHDFRRVVEQTVAALGRVDVLLNHAGIGTAVPAT
jgi:NAD(P)-dependent dehydrogenase (short-subunit alcohol dehydrogenase family)